MTIQEATALLKTHNEWRRGSEIGQANPTQLGIAIDMVVQYLASHPSEKETERSCKTCDNKYDPENECTKCVDSNEPYSNWKPQINTP